MSETWRILMIDDDPVVLKQTKRLLERRPLGRNEDIAVVTTESAFDNALGLLEATDQDLVVLDIRDDGGTESEALRGLQAYEQIRARRFVPIVFYTALPSEAADLERPPFTTVVSKTAEDEEMEASLRSAIGAVIDSGLPTMARQLAAQVQDVQKRFMEEFVEERWQQIAAPERIGEVGHLLLRTLSRSLSGEGESFQRRLQGDAQVTRKGVHPLRYYVFDTRAPLRTGDILTIAEQAAEPSGDADREGLEDSAVLPDGSWWVVLTPACDLVEEDDRAPKAEYVVLARCTRLVDDSRYAELLERFGSESPPTKLPDSLSKVVADNATPRNRYRFLPRAWDVPDLVVDLQRIVSVRRASVSRLTRIAALDDPYAQALVAQFVGYVGRTGTPDLDKPAEADRLFQQAVAAARELKASRAAESASRESLRAEKAAQRTGRSSASSVGEVIARRGGEAEVAP